MKRPGRSINNCIMNKARIGDWLLLPSGVPPLPAARTGGSWKQAFAAPGLTLWTSEPTEAWKGWSVKEDEDARYKSWCIGDLAPSGPALIEVLHRPSLARDLNGYFIAIAYEKPTDCWHIITNRFGTVHAYHSATRQRTGSYYPAVAHGESGLDWEGLAGFFRMGFFPGTTTYLKGVRILPMASRIVLDGGGTIQSRQRYWQWEHAPRPRASYGTAVAEWADVFHQVMDENTDEGRIGLPISGGLDSRSTVVAMARPQRHAAVQSRTWSYSYGYSDDSVETRISRRIARVAGFPFQAFTIRPYLFERLPRILEWTEGFQDITQSRQAYVRDELARHTDRLVGGLWGDVWHDTMGVPEGERFSDDALASFILKKMQKKGHEWLVQHVVKPNLGNDGTSLLKDHIHKTLRPLRSIEDLDFRVKAYKTEAWSFRWSIPPIRVFHSATLPRLVFYDTRLTDFFQTLPTSYVAQRRLQIEYIKQYAPALARITWQVYDANLYWYRYFHSLLLPKRAWKKLWRLIRRRKVITRNWEVQFLATPTQRRQLRDHLLTPGLRLHHYVERNEVEKLLDGFFSDPSPDGAIGYTVSMLLTFAAWLEWMKGKNESS